LRDGLIALNLPADKSGRIPQATSMEGVGPVSLRKLLQFFQSVIGAAVVLTCGCSLLDRGESAPPTTPPMIGAANPETEAGPTRRQKIRFASEISNAKERRPTVRSHEARVRATSTLAAAQPPSTPAAPSMPAGPPYPHTSPETAVASASPAFILTQRLPIP
jgi:hypothetical protein